MVIRGMNLPESVNISVERRKVIHNFLKLNYGVNYTKTVWSGTLFYEKTKYIMTTFPLNQRKISSFFHLFQKRVLNLGNPMCSSNQCGFIMEK